MKKYWIIVAAVILLVAFVLLLIFCCSKKDETETVTTDAGTDAGTGSKRVDGYWQITQDEAVEMMKKDDGHIVVDVRRDNEYITGHIPGAICIPNESITDQKPEELPDLSQVILIYCRSGNRSKQASKKLADIGYTNVYEFGGIIEWRGDTVKGSEPGEMVPVTTRPMLVIDTGKEKMYATFEDNRSADAFISKLSPSIISVNMEDYGGFEKVGDLPWSIVKSDSEITAKPGDIILYQGNKITVYYGQNTAEFTKLASIGNTDAEKMKKTLGEGSVTLEFSLEWSE